MWPYQKAKCEIIKCEYVMFLESKLPELTMLDFARKGSMKKNTSLK